MQFLYKLVSNNLECKPVHTTAMKKMKAEGWTVAKPEVAEVKKEPVKSMKDQAIELGLPVVDDDGKDIHHKTLAKIIEAKRNDQGSTSSADT